MTESFPQKKITVFDVASEAGVSKSSVSLVLTGSSKVSEKTRNKVNAAIQKTGYVYNRDAAALRNKKSNLVAIVINDLTNPYSAQLAVALEQQVNAIGMFSMLVNSNEDVERQTQLVQRLREYNVDAFIICPAPNTSAEWLNDLIKQNITVLGIMREIDGAKITTVMPDNIKGTELATKHLLSKGYQSIGFLGGNSDISDYHERLQGFTHVIQRSEMTFHQTLCIQSKTTRNGGRLAMQKLLNLSPDVEAIVCFSDVVAFGAIEHMRSVGKSPGNDIAIIGFDDLDDARLMTPSLTTVRVEAREIAEEVCLALTSASPQSTDKKIVDVNLILRESS